MVKPKQPQWKDVRELATDNETIHHKMQLWSNASGTEYALRLAIAPADDHEDFFLAKTDPKAIYSHVVAETDYLDDLREGWDYALRNFIIQYKLTAQQRPQESYLKNESMSSDSPSFSKIKSKESINRNMHYTIRLVPYLKCHYCKLEFHDVNLRREHELEWHI